MSFFDFNDADQSKPKDMLIPHGTIVPVHMTVRPGGAGPGEWLKRSNDGTGMMIDAEFTVIDGEWARKKFWSYFTVDGESEGQQQAAGISRSNIRAMLESARGIEPSDISEKAAAARRITGYGDLDGIRFWAVVKLEKGSNGYKDKNQFSYAVTPDRKEWSKLDQPGGSAGAVARPVAASPASRPAAAPVARSGGGKPSWAGGGSRAAAPQHAARAIDPDLNDKIPY